MTPLQQKRHRELELTLERAHEQRDDAIRRLVRCDGRLQMLMRQKSRLEKAMSKPVNTVPVSVAEGKLLDAPKPEPLPLPDDAVPDLGNKLDIPTFLQRSKETAAKDAAAVEAIKAEQAERKRTKSQVRIEKLKAKASGDTKRMPLTGREAFRFAAGQAMKRGAAHRT